MVKSRDEYEYVTGDDLEEIKINGEIMPLRTGNTDKKDKDDEWIPKKNILRGEDICFLAEAVAERLEMRGYPVAENQFEFEKKLDPFFVANLIDAIEGQGSDPFWLGSNKQLPYRSTPYMESYPDNATPLPYAEILLKAFPNSFDQRWRDGRSVNEDPEWKPLLENVKPDTDKPLYREAIEFPLENLKTMWQFCSPQGIPWTDESAGYGQENGAIVEIKVVVRDEGGKNLDGTPGGTSTTSQVFYHSQLRHSESLQLSRFSGKYDDGVYEINTTTESFSPTLKLLVSSAINGKPLEGRGVCTVLMGIRGETHLQETIQHTVDNVERTIDEAKSYRGVVVVAENLPIDDKGCVTLTPKQLNDACKSYYNTVADSMPYEKESFISATPKPISDIAGVITVNTRQWYCFVESQLMFGWVQLSDHTKWWS